VRIAWSTGVGLALGGGVRGRRVRLSLLRLRLRLLRRRQRVMGRRGRRRPRDAAPAAAHPRKRAAVALVAV
jgi:hypothetical protein